MVPHPEPHTDTAGILCPAARFPSASPPKILPFANTREATETRTVSLKDANTTMEGTRFSAKSLLRATPSVAVWCLKRCRSFSPSTGNFLVSGGSREHVRSWAESRLLDVVINHSDRHRLSKRSTRWMVPFCGSPQPKRTRLGQLWERGVHV